MLLGNGQIRVFERIWSLEQLVCSMGYMSQTLLRGVNFLSYDHTPELASNVWTIRLHGKLPTKSGCRM